MQTVLNRDVIGDSESHLSGCLSFFSTFFGRWLGSTNAILPVYDYELSGGDSERWWGHSNPTCCN